MLARLEADLAAALAAPGLAERLGDGLELLGGGSEVFARRLRADHARFGALLAKLDIWPDWGASANQCCFECVTPHRLGGTR